MSKWVNLNKVLSELKLEYKDFIYIDKNETAERIKALPTIEPKRGEWIVHEARAMVGELGIDFYPAEYVCSCCGFKESMYFIDREPYNYCPNCGTKMVKGEDNGIHK